MKVWLVVVGCISVKGQVDDRKGVRQYLEEEWQKGELEGSQRNTDYSRSSPGQRASLPENTEGKSVLSNSSPALYGLDPLYSYFYGEDPVSGDFNNHKETRQGNQVKGAYSVVELDGTLRTVEYTADPITGFKAYIKQIKTPMNKIHYAPDQRKYYPAEFKPRYLYKEISIYPNAYMNDQNYHKTQTSDRPIADHVYYALSYRAPTNLCKNVKSTYHCLDSTVSSPNPSNRYIAEPVTSSSLSYNQFTASHPTYNSPLGASLPPSMRNQPPTDFRNQNDLPFVNQYVIQKVYPAKKSQLHDTTRPFDGTSSDNNRPSSAESQFDSVINSRETHSTTTSANATPSPQPHSQQGSFYYFTMTQLPFNYH